MSQSQLLESQSAPDAQTLTTSTPWKLAKGRAVTLRPRIAGILRVTQGRAWATMDVLPDSPMSDAGDHFVAPGHDLPLRAGQRVVLESWPLAHDSDITVVWEPLEQAQTAQHWQLAVVEPLRDLGHAVLLAGHALGRLATGLATGLMVPFARAR